jgi:hypothetical protein
MTVRARRLSVGQDAVDLAARPFTRPISAHRLAGEHDVSVDGIDLQVVGLNTLSPSTLMAGEMHRACRS